MNWFWVAMGIMAAMIVLLSPRVFVRLFGAYCRYNPVLGDEIAFLTKRRAQRYGTRGLGAIDPYARQLSPDIRFQPGILIRRSTTTR